MNTCYCLRLATPHTRTHQCEVDRIDRMLARRQRRLREELDATYRDDFELDQDDDYKRQDAEARQSWRKV